MKLVRTTLVAVTAAALLATTPSPVHADVKVSTDVSGDVEKVTFNGDEVGAEAVPDRTNGDIVGIRVSVLPRAVKIRTRYRDLARVGRFQHVTLLDSPKGKRVVTIAANQANWRGKVTVRNLRGDEVRCAVSRTISYPDNTLSVSVPRSCLDNPNWVRVAQGTLTFYGQNLWIDEAYRKLGGTRPRYAFGPRVNL